jgi:flagellar biogenesis protein FliO
MVIAFALIEIVIIILLFTALIYVIVKRIQDKNKEDFENRDY